jgi:hypothetical protein
MGIGAGFSLQPLTRNGASFIITIQKRHPMNGAKQLEKPLVSSKKKKGEELDYVPSLVVGNRSQC